MRYRILRCAALTFAITLGPLLSLAPAFALAAVPQALSAATHEFAAQVLATGDHLQQPFAIVDKRTAVLTLFSASGRLLGSSSVLLGSVLGDHSVPGVGDRAQTGRLWPGDATTPAGRFASEPGHNKTGEAVVWLDYDLALAIHRLRPGTAQADRGRRLAAQAPDSKRVSAGCIVVPVAFYESVVQPLLGLQAGVVYVLPEHAETTILPKLVLLHSAPTLPSGANATR